MKVLFNGQEIESAFQNSSDFFKAHSQDESDVWIINGFASKEDQALKEGDELFCIPKGKMPPKQALEAMMRARHTPKLFDRLKRACVGVAGLGGLGSHISIMLARSGVGKLVLVDFDIIEPSNLNRQAYEISDLAKPKTEALKAHIAKINPFIEIEIHTTRVDEGNIKALFKDTQIVCEAFDNAAAKAMLAQNFHKNHPDKTLICASGLAGYGQSNAIQTRKITDKFYICGDLKSAAGFGNGLMAPRVNICAAHQANLVLELLAASKA